MPPALFFIYAGVMMVLHFLAPGPRLIHPPLTFLGWIPLGTGFLVAWLARHQFNRSGTTIKPFHESDVLLTVGAFAFSRNPMYTSLTAGLIGIFVLFGTLTPALVIPVFVWIIRSRFIAVEERMLEETFGDRYRAYKARVRRWI